MSTEVEVINAPHLNMTFYRMLHPHADLDIPETWTDVRAFADWWLESKMPIIFPQNPEVFLSDDATAITIFRQGQFQVELYLIYPNPKVPVHEHPGVEVIKMSLTAEKGPIMSNILKNGESHGAGQRMAAEQIGFPLVAFQHWLTREPTTIASMWKGPTVGPLQEALVKRFNPDAYVVDGYADITRRHDE
jgi:hypothetical protein